MTPEQTLFCSRPLQPSRSRNVFRDWKPKGHGALASGTPSCSPGDVYFYTVASKLGIDRMHDFMSIFGFLGRSPESTSGAKSRLDASPTGNATAYKRAAEQGGFGRKPSARHRSRLYAGNTHATRPCRIGHRIAR